LEKSPDNRPGQEPKELAPVVSRRRKKSINGILPQGSTATVVNACVDVPAKESQLKDCPQYQKRIQAPHLPYPGSVQQRPNLEPTHEIVDPTFKILILPLKSYTFHTGVSSCVFFCFTYFNSTVDTPSRALTGPL
jgi:hypothetical protein